MSNKNNNEYVDYTKNVFRKENMYIKKNTKDLIRKKEKEEVS